MMNNLFDRIKLLFRKDKELYSCLYRILGFYPKRIDYYKIALTHKSQVYRTKQGLALNNERLEFLGDAVLETVVSDIVYRQFVRKDEGFLTTTRSKVVQRETLNRVAIEMKLDRLVRSVANSASAHNNYMYGNAFEALVGAIYLDQGFGRCLWFFRHRVLGKYVDLGSMARHEVNFKSKLIEWCQKNKVSVVFPLKDETVEGSNSPVFRSEVILERIPAGRGEGYSKKESQQNAAKEALDRIRRDAKFANRVLAARDLHIKQAAEAEAAAQPASSTLQQADSAKPSRRRRRKKAETTKTQQETTATMPVVAASEQKKPQRRRRQADAEKVPAATPDRESIIRAAEEAAFREHAEDVH